MWSAAARPDVQGDGRRGGRVERLDPGPHGDPPAFSLAGGGPAARDPPRRRPGRTSGKGRFGQFRPGRIHRDQGRRGRAEIGQARADPERHLEQRRPRRPAARGWNGCAASRVKTTRATPKAAAERITAPTFSGSWNGTKRVQPCGHGCSSLHGGISGTRTSKSGACVPATSSALNSESARRIHGIVSPGGGGASGPVSQPRTCAGNRARTSSRIRDPGEDGLAVLADAGTAQDRLEPTVRRVGRAGDLADLAFEAGG